MTVCDTARVTVTDTLADVANSHGHSYPSMIAQLVDATKPTRTRSRGRVRRAVGRAVTAVRPLSGTLLGLGGFDAALWVLPVGVWSTVAGLLGIGLAGFVLEWRVRG